MTKRRDFLKNVGLGSLGALYPGYPAPGNAHVVAEPVAKEAVKLGRDVSIELLTRGNTFAGIGDVSVKGVSMRNGARPMFVQIDTPDGVSLTQFDVVEKSVLPESIRLVLQPRYTRGGIMEWMLHTVRNRRCVADWTEPEREAGDTRLELILTPVERRVGNQWTTGFSYQYRYQSASLPIYKILDRASWEINGRATGNSFWMRNGVVDTIVTFNDPSEFYSTEWYLPGIANPNIFQFHPLQTQLQGFTFTAAAPGTLVTWPAKVSHVRSLFEKWRGKNDIVHLHEHCSDLGSTLETSPVEVLWRAGNLDATGLANYYHHVRQVVHDELHRQVGMRRERISTYGVMEEWTEPDFDQYRTHGLAKLIDAGVKTVFIPNQCQNTMNTWGVSNMCCNVDFKISETTGEEKLKAFCHTARQAGVRVEMWGNTALSALTELFSHREGQQKGIEFLPYEGSVMEVIDKATSPWVRNPSNAIEADHYTPRFCALNLRDNDIRAYWMKQWKYFHDTIGIQGIFLDSSFNMSSDKFHFRQWPEGNGWFGATLDQKDALGKYRPATEPGKMIHTQYHAHLAWMAEMQNMGYHYCAEDMGVFGINRTGPGVVDRVSSLFLWEDCYCDFDEDALRKAGHDPYDVFFKGLSYRTMWKLYWDIPRDALKLGIDDPRAYALLKIFNAVTDHMYNRVLLADGAGVTYEHDRVKIVWCFGEMSLPLERRRAVTDLVSGKTFKARTLKGARYHVYKITDA